MARPKPTILIEHLDTKTDQAEQVLQADAIYAVYYKEAPINLRTLNSTITYPGPKYKKVSFSNPGHALNLAERLNEQFQSMEFAVYRLVKGEVYTEHQG